MSRSSTDARLYGAFPSAAAPSRRFGPYRRRIALAASVVLAAAAGVAITQDAASVQVAQAAEPELLLLLRFMAALKGVMALGAAALAWWRLFYPASTRLTASAIVASALMAFG